MTCEECVYAGYCALASLRGYDPCDTFEKRQDLRQEEAERMYQVKEDIHRKRGEGHRDKPPTASEMGRNTNELTT